MGLEITDLIVHDSATFTTSPTAPTPIAGDNSNKLATTEFVRNNSVFKVKTLNGLSLLGEGDVWIDPLVTSVNGQIGPVVLTKNDVGLGQCNDTSDLNKPISTATQIALNSKQSALVSGTNIKTINGISILGSGNLDFTSGEFGVSSLNGFTGPLSIRSVNGTSLIGTGNIEIQTTTGVFSLNSLTGHLNVKTINNISLLGSGNLSIADIAGNGVYMDIEQTLTLTGDVTSSVTSLKNGSLNTILSNTGVVAGTYPKVTVNSKGRVTSGSALSNADIPGIDASKIISGTIDPSRLPSYVDDVLEYISNTEFPATGENGKLYVDTETGYIYRWSGTMYIPIISGDVQSINGQTGLVTLTKSDIGLGNVDNTSDLDKPISTATQIALDSKQSTLVSGTNIKTINGMSVLGSGNLDLTSGGFTLVNSVNTKTGDVLLDKTDIGLGNVDNIKQLPYTQQLTLSGDIISSATDISTGSIVGTLSNTGVIGGYYTKVQVDSKGRVISGTNPNTISGYNITDAQPTLVSGSNIKTIGGVSLLGSGDISLSSLGVSSINGQTGALSLKTIGGTSILGSGDISLSSLGLTKNDVGLNNVDNTSDLNKPVSTATQTALNLKQNTLVSGTNIKTIGGTSILGSGDISLSAFGVSSINGQAGALSLKSINGISLLGSGGINVVTYLFDSHSGGTVVGGINIATINNKSILNTSNIVISKSDVGLGNVDDTSDLNKPVSTATQTALNTKQDTLVSGTNIKTINGQSVLGTGDIEILTNEYTKDEVNTLLNSKQNSLVSGTNIKTINGQSVLGTGDITIVGGSGGTSIATFTEHNFTATANQTTFTVDYTVGKIEVYVEGFKLTSDNFVASNGTTVVLNTPCNVGYNVNIIVWSAGTSIQEVLSSGVNIKTINGESVLGSGDITINNTFFNATANNTYTIDFSAIRPGPAPFEWNQTVNDLTIIIASDLFVNDLREWYYAYNSSMINSWVTLRLRIISDDTHNIIWYESIPRMKWKDGLPVTTLNIGETVFQFILYQNSVLCECLGHFS